MLQNHDVVHRSRRGTEHCMHGYLKYKNLDSSLHQTKGELAGVESVTQYGAEAHHDQHLFQAGMAPDSVFVAHSMS